jgi:hypothetical protein
VVDTPTASSVDGPDEVSIALVVITGRGEITISIGKRVLLGIILIGLMILGVVVWADAWAKSLSALIAGPLLLVAGVAFLFFVILGIEPP